MFWFSMDYYQETITQLEAMGWWVNPFPLIWHKSDNMGILPDPTRGPRRIYETCLIASRGDRKIVRAVSNVVSHPTTKTIHMSEKPIGMLTKFMEMFVDEHTALLDPTCGSGNAIRAAEARGAHAVLGLERDTEFFNRAKEAYLNGDE
jgi:DNA modification methylase